MTEILDFAKEDETKENMTLDNKASAPKASQTTVYQGHQIGGCVTVITAHKGDETRRIMIDYGSSLPGSEITKDFEYPWDREPVEAVLFTHYHGDHVGRLLDIPENVKLYMGATARQVMLNIHKYLMRVKSEHQDEHRRAFEILSDDSRIYTYEYDKDKKHFLPITGIPLFRIEPYSVDHSAYDAYMFLIEAWDESLEKQKKVIVHTGDFRGHGRRGKAMMDMIYYYIHQNKGPGRIGGPNKREVDELIIEGTMLSRPSDVVMTETQMQKKAEELFRNHRHVFLICSSTNLDSLASFYMAWKNVNPYGKKCLYVYSNYLKEQLETFSKTAGEFSKVYKFENVYRLLLDKELNHPLWKKAKSQKEIMEEKGFLAIIKAEDFCEEYIDAFMDCEDKPLIIFSMWNGYLNPDHRAYNREMGEFIKRQEDKKLTIEYLHTSGHATAGMISEVINAIAPTSSIIPMHTEKPDEFQKLDIEDRFKAIIDT